MMSLPFAEPNFLFHKNLHYPDSRTQGSDLSVSTYVVLDQAFGAELPQRTRCVGVDRINITPELPCYGDVSESGLADLVFHGGALGAHFRINRRREVVCVFLVHQTAVQVQYLKDKLVQQVNELFPVPDGR